MTTARHTALLLGAALAFTAPWAANPLAAKEWPRIRIATEGAYPPFNMHAPDGRLIGYDTIEPVVPRAPVGRGLTRGQRARRAVTAGRGRTHEGDPAGLILLPLLQLFRVAVQCAEGAGDELAADQDHDDP